MMPVRIAILTDNRLFRDGLLRIIAAEDSFVAVGDDETATLRPALRAARPDVLVVDGGMEGVLALCAELKGKPGPAIVLVAPRGGDDWALGALEAGARGILASSAGAEDLLKAVRVVHEGQIWARRQVMAEWVTHAIGVPARPPSAAILERLTSREGEIFRHAATGLSNKEVAHRLAISQATVKAHLTRIFQKLGLRGRTNLAAAYHGLNPIPRDSSPPLAIRRSARTQAG